MNNIVFLDAEACLKCGTCTAIAPDVFEFAGNMVVVADDAPVDGQSELIQTAIDACPVAAIKWLEK